MIKRSRTFTPWSHVVSLLYAQLTHAIGLNDVCDALRLRSGPLSAVRGATPPSKNALSTANRERSAQMAQDLFYAVLGHLEKLHPGFGRERRPRFAFRFKRVIHLVDATPIRHRIVAKEAEAVGVDHHGQAVLDEQAAEMLEVIPSGVRGDKDCPQEFARMIINRQEQGLFFLGGPPLVDGGVVLPEFVNA